MVITWCSSSEKMLKPLFSSSKYLPSVEQRLIYSSRQRLTHIPWAKYVYIFLFAWWQTHMHPPGRKQPRRLSLLRGKADESLLYYYPAILSLHFTTTNFHQLVMIAVWVTCKQILHITGLLLIMFAHLCFTNEGPRGCCWGLPVWLMCVEISLRPQTAWPLYSRL